MKANASSMENQALMTAIHIADTFRLWSVPAAFLGTIMLAPIACNLGRLLLADWLSQRGMNAAALKVGFHGDLDDSVMHAGPRFWAFFGAILFMLAILVAGLIIPFSRSGAVDMYLILFLDTIGFGWIGVVAAWRSFLILSWGLWALGCWIIVLSIAPRPKWMVVASVLLWWAAYVGSEGIGKAII